jgi:hypothetical protein
MCTVHTYQGVAYLRISELSAHEQEAFRTWLFGQTTPGIPGLPPEDLAYVRDYERWRQKQQSSEVPDWD